jgi:hypothetical protein
VHEEDPAGVEDDGGGVAGEVVPFRATAWSGPRVRPPSVDRFRTMSMWPWSAAESTRPSQKASKVGVRVTTTAGIRKLA